MRIARRELLLGAATGLLGADRAVAQRRPNVILIVADDLGYGDLGCYGSQLQTPNLDRMARQGMRFTNVLAANSVCSPSRAALLTGRYAPRVGVTRVLMPNDTIGLNLDETTLASMLKQAGYRTACIGKWHLGRPEHYLPTNRGFDSYFGIPYSNDMQPLCLMRDTRIIEDPVDLDTLTIRYTTEALSVIESSGSNPFFLYLPQTYPHIPLSASPRFRGRSALGLYGDTVEELDWGIGEILAALEKNKLDRDTLVLFSSDNGPWYQGSASPLRGRKGTSWEGGVRVPFIAYMPGTIRPGAVCNEIASLMDIFPTLARTCRASLPTKPLDGCDIWPLLTGQRPIGEREPLLTFDGPYLHCIRSRRWKLHVSRLTVERWNPAPGGAKNLKLKFPELYDLDRDPAESFDVAALHPRVVESLLEFAERKLATFPEAVRAAHRELMSTDTLPGPAGAVPRAGRTATH